jgi:hypothetical protein
MMVVTRQWWLIRRFPPSDISPVVEVVVRRRIMMPFGLPHFLVRHGAAVHSFMVLVLVVVVVVRRMVSTMLLLLWSGGFDFDFDFDDIPQR